MNQETRNLLIVEDDSELLSLIKSKLDSKNISYDSACAVKEGMMKVDEVKFKIISLDISLGDENAAQIITHISSQNYHLNKGSIFVVFSQHVNNDFKIKMRKKGIKAYNKSKEFNEYIDWLIETLEDRTVGEFEKLLEDDVFDSLAEGMINLEKMDI